MPKPRLQRPSQLAPTGVWQPTTAARFVRARRSKRAKRRDPHGGHYRGKHAKNSGNAVACHLLCNRCSYRKNSKRCRNFACQDFSLCWIHLMTQGHLRVAPSRIRGAGLGLYAIHDYATWKRSRDARGRPRVNRQHVVFREGEVVAVLKGERLTTNQLNRRYPGNVRGDYAVTNAQRGRRKRHYDQLCARSANAYANDCGGSQRRSRQACNAVMQDLRGRAVRSGLVATRDIYHGEEILTDYGEAYWAQ